jgi:hypothetical protein
MTAVPTIVRQRIDTVPMKVGPGDVPVLPIRLRPHQEGALRGTHEQEHVPVLDSEVLDAAQHQRPRTGRLFAPRCAHDGCRLDGLERRANVAGALEAVLEVLRQAAQDDGAQAGRHARRQRPG